MVREFAISAGGVTVAGATTLISINPAAAPNFNIEMLRFWVGQSANATSAQQRIQLLNKASVFPTLTSYTPTKLKVADPNVSIIAGGTAGAIATCGVNASAEGAGAATVRWDDAFNVLNGWLHVPTPPETQVYPAGFGNSIGLYFPVAPTTLTNWAAGAIYREV
jgi:hypothetical protein